MTPERWARLKELLDAAATRPEDERDAFLDAACGHEGTLRRELAEFLECQAEMGDFLEAPLLPDRGAALDEGVSPELRAWNRYDILDVLGAGGMAVVYKAWDPRLHRFVALKVIGGRDDLTIARFLREAEAQARVTHEHVLEVYETGVIGQQHYIAMRYVDGPTLIGVRDETSLEHKVHLMVQIAEGLHAAHREGLIHRDIKPGNILVERGADRLRPFLLDFGLAVEVGAPSLTVTGMLIGTPRYMAPERIHGTAAPDRRSDVYSLGATFYEFISGKAPFASTSGLRVLVDVLESEFTPLRTLDPSVPQDVDAIVAKCLEKDPARRYASARALADDLRRFLDGAPVQARPQSHAGRVIRKARRHPRAAAAFAVFTLVTAIVAGWGAYGYWRSARQADLAQMLGQEVRDLEWLYRAAQMSPLHPIEPTRREIRERMARLEAIVDRPGSVASGPVNYALGRGHLALGDHSRALDHLQLAWDAGYRTQDAALALGLAHGEAFRAESARTERIADDRQRAARLRQLETMHRDRALSFLAAGRSGSIVPSPYIDALLASHRGDLKGAVEKANEAARNTPWLFEARLLPGQLELIEAVRLYFAGNVRDAAAHANEADRHFAEAQRVAASAIDAHVGRCSVGGLVLHMAHHGLAADPEPPYAQATDACSRALVVDPANAEAYRLFGEAVRFWGNGRVQKGQHPGDAYERSVEFTSRAVELSADDLEPLVALADTFLDQAWWQRKQGEDPRPALEHVVTTYERVLAIDARNMTAWNNMGQALLLRSRVETALGVDPSRSHDRAIESFMRGLHTDPTAFGFRNLARVGVERAEAQRGRGVDPSAGIDETMRFIETLPGDAALPARVEALATLRGRRK